MKLDMFSKPPFSEPPFPEPPFTCDYARNGYRKHVITSTVTVNALEHQPPKVNAFFFKSQTAHKKRTM